MGLRCCRKNLEGLGGVVRGGEGFVKKGCIQNEMHWSMERVRHNIVLVILRKVSRGREKSGYPKSKKGGRSCDGAP